MRGEMKRAEIQKAFGLSDGERFVQNYMLPALQNGFIELTILDKPNSPKQSYRLTTKGLALKERLKDK